MLVRTGLSALLLVALATTAASAGTSAPTPGGDADSVASDRPFGTRVGEDAITGDVPRLVGDAAAEGPIPESRSPWNSRLLFGSTEDAGSVYASTLAIETMEMVPLPGAAISGLVVLGGIGIYAILRRRRRRRKW